MKNENRNMSPSPLTGWGEAGRGAESWHVPDPASQFASAYVGMGNNPVSLTDLDGMWAVGTYGGYSRMLAAAGRELALMYQDYYDWIDMFSARYGNMGNVAIWHFSVGGSGGNAALSFTTESGSMISTKPEYWNESASEAQGLFYNRRKGEIGNYYQTSGSIRYYINEQGQTVNVLTSEVIAKWVAYGGAAPEWNDVGWRGLSLVDLGSGATYYDNALKYKSAPYLKGGMTKEGIDCSGLVNRATDNETRVWNTSMGNPPGNYNKITVRNNSYDNFIADVIKGDLFLWPNEHAAFYAGDGGLFHAHGTAGTPTGYTYDLKTWWIPNRGYPDVYRQSYMHNY
jgi:hypothetical protein